MFNKLLQWLGITSTSPQLTVVERRPIDAFIQATQMGAPQQMAMMGSLSESITQLEFADFCRCFADGIAYVANRFGTCPKAIVLTDESNAAPRYNVESQNIYLPRTFIHGCLSLKDLRQSKTEPYVLTAYQGATVYGIEEAYHHYQYTKHRDYYYDLGQETKPTGSGYTEGYDNHPLEYDSERVIRQAIVELGFDTRMYQMIPGTKPLNWCEKLNQKPQQTGVSAAAAR